LLVIYQILGAIFHSNFGLDDKKDISRSELLKENFGDFFVEINIFVKFFFKVFVKRLWKTGTNWERLI